MSEPSLLRPNAPAGGEDSAPGGPELKEFVGRVQERVRQYLLPRSDNQEQTDHLRHVADRTRWIYYGELQRQSPGASVRFSHHDDDLIEACVLSHDIGKWIPREELHALIPADVAEMQPTFAELKFTNPQSDLLLLGIRRRFALAQDGYVPEYDSAHHLVSAYLLAADDQLGFHHLLPADQKRLIDMIVGHQFGSYFKESLLHLKVQEASEVTTGMIMDVSRPDRVMGDVLASAFHDADISDLLFVGSLEPRPNREDIFHTGGLVKILMVNFTNRIYGVPTAPKDLAGCLRSCQGTVNNVRKELITRTAIEHGSNWRREARRFLSALREKSVSDKLNAILLADDKPAAERLTLVRSVTRLQAREFLNRSEDDK